MTYASDSDQKFLTSKQESLRLDIALTRFFEVESDEWQNRYGTYLKMRLRPAMELLIEANDMDRIERLTALGWLNADILETSIRFASEKQRTEILIYLLHQKKDLFGFSKQTYTL